MNFLMMSLHAEFMEAEDSADYQLLVSVTLDHGNVATVCSIPLDDPNLSQRLRDIAQSFRMGTRYGRQPAS